MPSNNPPSDFPNRQILQQQRLQHLLNHPIHRLHSPHSLIRQAQRVIVHHILRRGRRNPNDLLQRQRLQKGQRQDIFDIRPHGGRTVDESRVDIVVEVRSGIIRCGTEVEGDSVDEADGVFGAFFIAAEDEAGALNLAGGKRVNGGDRERGGGWLRT